LNASTEATPNSGQDRPLRVFLVYTGVDRYRGGFETFARECFDGLCGTPGLDIQLIKGSGGDRPGEQRVWCLLRSTPLARFLAWSTRRSGYAVEQFTSLLPVARRIRAQRPDIVFLSDESLLRRLYRYRKWIGVPFRLLFSNGAPYAGPFPTADHVHQVTPHGVEIALQRGETRMRQTMVPYGIAVPEGDPAAIDPALVQRVRRQLRLPLDRKIVLSVGWISSFHKRMDYVISEVAALPPPRPLLVLLGRMDRRSAQIVRLGNQLLGPDGFRALSVPHQEVTAYYQAADVFALASLTEGFGRVYAEAMIEGLPCIVHDDPVMRYVLAEEGTYADLSQKGALTRRLAELLDRPRSAQEMIRRRQSVRDRFAWKVLAPAYLQMFRACLHDRSLAAS